VAPSLTRVGKTDAPGTVSSIAVVWRARGDGGHAGCGARSGGRIDECERERDGFDRSNGATIATSNVTLYREYYITVTGTASYGGGSNPPLGSGTYAEPLIPFNDPETGAALCGSSATLKACNASVSSGQNQPYWIDISIPHGVGKQPGGNLHRQRYGFFVASEHRRFQFR